MTDTATRTIVTLAEARAFLNIPSTETGMDVLLAAILDGLNERIEKFIRTNLINQSETEYHNGNNKPTIYLRKPPVITITSITEDDVALAESTYILDAEAGIITKDTTASTETFAKGEQNIKVVYTAGLGAARANIPEDLKLALKLWATYVYKGLTDYSRQLTESNLVVLTGKKMPDDIAEILKGYQRETNTYSGV